MTFATFTAGFPKQKQYQKPGKAVVEMSATEGASTLREKCLAPLKEKMEFVAAPAEGSDKLARTLTKSLWFSACRGKVGLITTERHGHAVVKVCLRYLVLSL